MRDAYDRGEVTTAQYLGAGVGGGLAVAGVSLATAGTGSGFVAGGTTLAAQAGRAALIGAGEGLVTDVLTQSALVSVGVQEEFSVRQTVASTLLGAGIGGGAAGAGGLVNTVRRSQFAAGVTAQVKTKATQVASSARAKVANVASRVTREIPSGARSVGQSLSGAAQGVRQAARELGDLARRIEPNGVGMFGGGFRIRPKTAPGGNVADSFLGPRQVAGTPGQVTGGSSTTLGANLFEQMGLPRGTSRGRYQAQHILPSEVQSHPVIQRLGVDFDDASNGIFLRVPDEALSPMSRHRGYHSVYNEVVERHLNRLDASAPIHVLDNQVGALRRRLRFLQEQGTPLYPSQGATVELWERLLSEAK